MRHFLPLVSLIVFCACSRGLRTGDLLFVCDDPGDFSEAVRESTDGGYSHVGFYERGHGVWEASPARGVCCTPLAEFLAEYPCVRAFRTKCDKRYMLSRVRALEGRPYDFCFEPGDSALYCSELVQECYRDTDGKPLFGSISMNFAGPDGEILEYWQHWYDSLGRPVPQGAPGTNPNTLARSPLLSEITYQQE